MSEAQKGELPSDDVVVEHADHRDWKVILSDTVPGFQEWLTQHDPDSET